MYEMYPDAWPVADDSQPEATGAKPRRRARKEHSVTPVVLGRTVVDKPAQAA